MWNRKELKTLARRAVKGNYWRAAIACVLMAVFTGAYAFSVPGPLAAESVAPNFRTATSTEIVNGILREYVTSNSENQRTLGDELLRATGNEDLLGNLAAEAGRRVGYAPPTRGVLAVFFNNATQSGSLLFGTLNALNQLIFKDSIAAGVLILVGVFVSFLFWLFLGNVLKVGERRFFLESRRYRDTPVARLLFLYKLRAAKRPVWVMFCHALWVGLWCLTIVGGIVANYALYMVPFLLAENPTLTRKEAFRLSRRMMRGNKWRTFLLDASFWGWGLLSTATFGLVGMAYANPYKAATEAELYMALRARAMVLATPGSAALNDTALAIAAVDEGLYPAERFPLKARGDNWLLPDYHRTYTLQSLVLLFFSFCVIGWVWEVLVDLFNLGVFTNRGTLLGPWLPLYGTGGVLVLLLTKKWRDRPVLTFALVVGICGVLEYGTSLILENLLGVRYWNYDGYLLNLQGRVCLEGLLVFGIAGCLGIYLLAPALDDLYAKMPKRARANLCLVLVLLFCTDLAWSALHPRTGERISFPLAEEAAIDEQPPGLL